MAAAKWMSIPLASAVAVFIFLSLAVLTDSVPVFIRPVPKPFVLPPPARKSEVPSPPEIAPMAPQPPALDLPLPAKPPAR